MARPRLHVLASGAFALAFGSPACSDDEQSSVPFLVGVSDGRGTGGSSMRGAGGRSGEAGNGGTPGVAGETGGSPAAGAGGAPSGGAGAGGGNAGAGQAGQAGADGGTDGSAPVTLSVCVRLQSPSVLSFDVTREYDHKVYADCRVKWVSNLYLDVDKREVFLNNLLAWNMRFWGCAPPPPDDFALIFTPTPLTSADASALIDDYIEVATGSLGLSAPEIAKMRAALDALAKSVVATVSNEFSHSQCVTDAGSGGAGGGGASGTGGTGGTATGAGGTDGSAPVDASSDAESGS